MSQPTANPVDPSTWVDEYGDYLLRYARSRVRSQAQAEDLVQDTFLSAIRSLERFGGRSSVKTWLTSILRNKIFDIYRKSGREENFSDLAAFYEKEESELFSDRKHWKSDGSTAPGDWKPDQYAKAEASDFWDAFQSCAAKLPERARRVFTMREIDDVSGAEICKMIGISEQNFWTIMHRTRMALRKCLETNMIQPEGRS